MANLAPCPRWCNVEEINGTHDDIIVGDAFVLYNIAVSTLRGNYCNLEHFLPINPYTQNTEAYTLDVMMLTIHDQPPAITSYDMWLTAW